MHRSTEDEVVNHGPTYLEMLSKRSCSNSPIAVSWAVFNESQCAQSLGTVPGWCDAGLLFAVSIDLAGFVHLQMLMKGVISYQFTHLLDKL